MTLRGCVYGVDIKLILIAVVIIGITNIVFNIISLPGVFDKF